MATYTFTDIAGTNPTTNLEIDSGVATAPADRPPTFTPAAGYVPSAPASDYGVGSTPAVRPMAFEALSATVMIDPGLTTSG